MSLHQAPDSTHFVADAAVLSLWPCSVPLDEHWIGRIVSKYLSFWMFLVPIERFQ